MKIIWPQSSLTYSPADDIYAVFERIVVCDTEIHETDWLLYSYNNVLPQFIQKKKN